MRVAGIAVGVPLKGRPAVRLVVVIDSPTLAVETAEEFPSAHGATAEQLHDAAESIRSRLASVAVDRVVIRRADHSPVPANREGPRLRLLMEGAVASAARSVVVDTRLGTGKDTGVWFGATKQDVDAAALALLSASGLSAATYADAMAAAFAALKL